MTKVILSGTEIEFSSAAKYLGVTFDKKLNWNGQLDAVINKATKAFFACSRLLGKTWGLTPKMTSWSFNTVVTPRTASTKLRKLHRMICIGITGAMKTCPTDALSALIGIPRFLF